jgi:hypothetical protein
VKRRPRNACRIWLKGRTNANGASQEKPRVAFDQAEEISLPHSLIALQLVIHYRPASQQSMERPVRRPSVQLGPGSRKLEFVISLLGVHEKVTPCKCHARSPTVARVIVDAYRISLARSAARGTGEHVTGRVTRQILRGILTGGRTCGRLR